MGRFFLSTKSLVCLLAEHVGDYRYTTPDMSDAEN